MNNELIVVKQLPIIEEQLREIKESVKARVGKALSMVCNEETRQSVKEARASLNKEFAELEARRKEVKAAIMAPYDAFEALYKECAADIYKSADTELKAKIDEVECGLKQEKTDEVFKYFAEYRASLGIDEDIAQFEKSGICITLSSSKKSLKSAAKSFLDRVAGDLAVIDVQEHKDEILVEYKKSLDLSAAITTVDQRKKSIEAEHLRREESAEKQTAHIRAQEEVERIIKEEAPLAPPTASIPADLDTKEQSEVLYTVSFQVTDTIEGLRALKRFLVDGGYRYEQL